MGPLFLVLGGGPSRNRAMQETHGARSPPRGGPAPSGARGRGSGVGPPGSYAVYAWDIVGSSMQELHGSFNRPPRRAERVEREARRIEQSKRDARRTE